MRRFSGAWIALALLGISLLAAPAQAAPKAAPKSIAHSVSASASFGENTDSVFNLSVSRSGLVRCPSTVAWELVDGTATRGSDFSSSPSGTLTFGKNQTSAALSVTVLNDGLEESTEAFSLVLTSPSSTCKGGVTTTLANATTAVTITDTDKVFTVGDDERISLTNMSLSSCNDAHAYLFVEDMGTGLLESIFLGGNGTDNSCEPTSLTDYELDNAGFPLRVRLELIDLDCDVTYHSDTTAKIFTINGSFPSPVNHALVTPVDDGWHVGINAAGAGCGQKTVNNPPTTATDGSFQADVHIAPIPIAPPTDPPPQS